jgi:proteic killer suppression protein
MIHTVHISRGALKEIKKIPRHILIKFDLWVEIIETDGYEAMKKVKGFNDHALVGDRKGQRSSYLSRSWRVIYRIDNMTNLIHIEVLEVHNHDY